MDNHTKLPLTKRDLTVSILTLLVTVVVFVTPGKLIVFFGAATRDDLEQVQHQLETQILKLESALAFQKDPDLDIQSINLVADLRQTEAELTQQIEQLKADVAELQNIGRPVSQSQNTQFEFSVKHIRDVTGEHITEVVSYTDEPGLDNSTGTAPLQVQIQFERNYRYQFIERLSNNDISGQRVLDKIVELYKLPPHDPEGTIETALCPISIIIPAEQKATVTVEWTERWGEGVVNEGASAQGKQLGTFSVFLGYIEPCSLVAQENVN